MGKGGRRTYAAEFNCRESRAWPGSLATVGKLDVDGRAVVDDDEAGTSGSA